MQEIEKKLRAPAPQPTQPLPPPPPSFDAGSATDTQTESASDTDTDTYSDFEVDDKSAPAPPPAAATAPETVAPKMAAPKMAAPKMAAPKDVEVGSALDNMPSTDPLKLIKSATVPLLSGEKRKKQAAPLEFLVQVFFFPCLLTQQIILSGTIVWDYRRKNKTRYACMHAGRGVG